MFFKSSDPFSSEHQKEFASFQSTRKQYLLGLGLVIILIIGGIFAVVSSLDSSRDQKSTARAKMELNATNYTWAQELVSKQSAFRHWLYKRGTSGELKIFDSVSRILFNAALSITGYGSDLKQSGILVRSYVALQFAALRVSFLILACWRLWAIVIILTILLGVFSVRIYEGANFLGQTGNGRMFYSGIRAALENLNKEGAPELQVTGLACIPNAPEAEVESSKIARVLKKYGAANDTNYALTAMLIQNKQWPAYVAAPDEEAILESTFKGGSLLDATYLIVEKALEIHKHYQENPEEELANSEAGNRYEQQDSGPIDLNEYTRLFKQALHRVLTPNMRTTLAQIDAQEVATFILAFQAGKIMAYANEGQRWIRKSAFSQLTARATLHSVASFAQDYDYYARQRLRRALIYGSRSSVFGPVRFPKDLSIQSRTLRQWVEVLMACPHELQTVADEVELFGLICEVHTKWHELFFSRITEVDANSSLDVFASQTNLLLVPFSIVIEIMQHSIQDNTLRRLRELVTLVNQKQKLVSMSKDMAGDSLNSGVPTYERIFRPLNDSEIKELISNHDLKEADIKNWSPFRDVLNSFGWLARRVGDYSVPESAIIYGIISALDDISDKNELGFVGRKGLVAFRGTRMEEEWGSQWLSRFKQATTANMAETPEHYSRLMQGIPDDFEEEGAL